MKDEQTSVRRLILRRLLSEAQKIASQDELLLRLHELGYHVTQSTLSRDLKALGVRRIKERGGNYIYKLPAADQSMPVADELSGLMKRLVTGIDSSQNLTIVKTQAGAGSTVAAAIDRNPPPGCLATLAGDDTILVVAKKVNGGADLARELMKILNY